MEISSASTKQGTKTRRHSIGTVIPKGLTESTSSSSSQSQTTVPHYLRASTGSCHDFCKYGGRNAFEEEKTGSNNKKTGSTKGAKPPPWKDILSDDAIPKISKPGKVPLVSMETSSARSKSKPSKPKLIRQTSSERPVKPIKLNLHGHGSMEISSTSTKPIVSAKPNLGRRGSMGISSTSTKPVVSAKLNLRGQGSMEISSSLTKINIGKPAAPKEVKRAKEINGKKIEEKKHEKQNEIGKEIKNGTRNGNKVECGEEKMINTIRSESPKVDSNFYENRLNSEEIFEEMKPALNEAVEIIFEKEGEKGIMNDEIFVVKLNECAFNEPILKNNIESVLSEPVSKNNIESVLSETVEPVSKNNIESMTTEIREISRSDKDPNAIGEKSGSSSSETSKNSEMESESELESVEEEDEEEELASEFESESELENEQIETNGNKESLKFTNRRKRSGVIKEEEKAYKLKFKPGRIIELKSDEDTPPKRLKFRKPSERNPNPSGDSGRKASYKKKSMSGSDCMQPVKLDLEPVNSVLLRHQDGQERKEGQNGLFNHVIEETASKLAESRKSKVKALVGAFETVISLQDGKP